MENTTSSSKRILGVEKNVFFLGLTSLFTDISSEMIYPLVPIFLTSVLGAPIAIVGLIEGIAESTASILKVFSGWVSDIVRRRKPLAVAGYSFSAIAKPLIVVSTVWWQVLIARFLDRFGKGVRTSPRDALIADSSSPDTFGRSFGLHRGMDTLGAAAGPLLAFALLPLFNNDLRSFFALAVIPAAIGVLILVFFVQEARRHGEIGRPRLHLGAFNTTFKRFLLITLIFTVGNSSDAFLILRAQNVGVSVVLIPLVYFVFNAVYSVTSVPAGTLSDRIGRKSVIIMGFVVFSLVYLGFALVTSPPAVWPLFAAYGLYYAFTESIFKAFTADLVPSELRGSAYGFLNLILGIGLFPASVIAGFLWDRISPQAPFFFGSALAIVALVLFMVLIPGDRSISGQS